MIVEGKTAVGRIERNPSLMLFRIRPWYESVSNTECTVTVCLERGLTVSVLG